MQHASFNLVCCKHCHSIWRHLNSFLLSHMPAKKWLWDSCIFILLLSTMLGDSFETRLKITNYLLYPQTGFFFTKFTVEFSFFNILWNWSSNWRRILSILHLPLIPSFNFFKNPFKIIRGKEKIPKVTKRKIHTLLKKNTQELKKKWNPPKKQQQIKYINKVL